MASPNNLDFGTAVFVDTAAWIALIKSGDMLHRPAIRIMKDCGLPDCTSFVLMSVRQIYHAFTSYLHFEQAGFLRLM